MNVVKNAQVLVFTSCMKLKKKIPFWPLVCSERNRYSNNNNSNNFLLICRYFEDKMGKIKYKCFVNSSFNDIQCA